MKNSFIGKKTELSEKSVPGTITIRRSIDNEEKEFITDGDFHSIKEQVKEFCKDGKCFVTKLNEQYE